MKRTLGVSLVALCAALVLAPPAWGGNQATYDQMVSLGAQIHAAKADPAQAQAVGQLLEQYRALAASLGDDDPAGLLDGAGSSSLVGGTAQLAPAAPPNGTTTTATFSNVTPVPIPAGPSTQSSTVMATTADTYIWDIDLTIDVTHTFAADLEIFLTSPAGTTIVITTDNGGGNDNVFSGSLFDDSALNAVNDFGYTNLVTATPLIPEGAMAAFVGEDPNGIWTLDVNDDAAGDAGTLNSWSLDVTTLAMAPIDDPVLNAANNTPLPIPAGPSMQSSTVSVAGAGAFLCDVNLTVAITHTFAADLEIFLTSPAGTTTTITTDNGGGNDDVFNGTTFDDSATDAATDFAYTNLVVATPLQPEGAMGAFIGEDPNGTWTIDVNDDAAGDAGRLESWSVDVTTCAGVVPNVPVVTIPTLNTIGLAVLLLLLVAAAFWALRRRTV